MKLLTLVWSHYAMLFRRDTATLSIILCYIHPRPPFRHFAVTILLAMLHLRSLHQSMLKAARPLAFHLHSIDGLVPCLECLSGQIIQSAVNSVVISGSNTNVFHLYVDKGARFLAIKSLISYVRGPRGEYFRRFCTILRDFPRTMTDIPRYLSWWCRFSRVS